MTESISDAFQCNQCGALYDSEKELREHRQAAHHPISAGLEPDETSKKQSAKPEDVSRPVQAKAKNA
jgi:C2H2-type zinc finger